MKLKSGDPARSRRGSAPVIAAIVLFGIILSVGSTYFYTTMTQQRQYQQQVYQHLQQQKQIQQGASNLVVYGEIVNYTTDELSINITNSGTAVGVAAFWVMNGTNAAILDYENHTTLPNILPFELNQGQSVIFNTTLPASSTTQTYMIKVVTSSGVVSFGWYPNGFLSTAALNSDVAAGLGSAKMTFDSFTYYDYLSGPPSQDSDNDFDYLCDQAVQCNGGNNVLNMKGHSGSLVPEGQNHTGNGCGYCGITVPIAFSINITNVDPQHSTLVFTSNANLWVIETCDAGTPTSTCGATSPVYVFYIMNVNQTTGAISNTFSQITIPYGITKTLFFGAAYPLTQQAFQIMSLGTDDSVIPGNNEAIYGQFAVFLLLPGTKAAPTAVQLYSQNIPFESTIAGDNLGWYSETPNTCTGDSYSIFKLQVNNSAFSGASINQIVLNASAFSSVNASAPSGWSVSINQGFITWSSSSNAIAPNSNTTFNWGGLAPGLSYSTEFIFPLEMYWNGGAFTVLQAAAACYVNANTQYTLPKNVPSGVLFYVPITLANLQSSAVPGGTQVVLNVDWNTYSSYLDNPVNNIAFFDYSGNNLNTWLQSGTSNTASSSILWLKLNSTGIKALTSITIFMGFYATGSNHLSSSGPFGEAPTLTGTYGQYDDGAKVFNFYDNFAGTTLSGQWTKVNSGSGVTITVNNGLTVKTTSTSAYGYVVGPSETAPLVAETYTSSGDSILGVTTSHSVNTYDAPYSGYSLSWRSSYDNMTYQGSSKHTTLVRVAQNTFPAGVWQVTWSATGSEYFSDGLGNSYTGSDSSSNLANYGMYIGQSNGLTASSVFQWARMRVVLPNNAMPAEVYGPITAA